MDQVFEDYLNKKSDMIQVNCDCGEEAFIFVEGIKNYYTICRKCGKRILFVNCQNPKCQTGYAWNESAKEISLAEQSWKCSSCKTTNHGLPEEQIKNYYKTEIPSEVVKEEAGRSLLPKWVAFVLAALFAIYYIYKLLANISR